MIGSWALTVIRFGNDGRAGEGSAAARKVEQMTYPPGPPSGPGFGGDPNAHGQQPDPAWWDQPATPPPGANPVQPQPGWPAQPEQPGWQQQQPPAWGAQPGYEQQQPPYGQQPGYGQPQPAFGQPGYGQPPPQPPRSNTGLIVGIVVGVVAVLAVAIGAIVVVTNSGDSDDQAVATSTTTTETTTTAPTTTRKTTTTTKAAPGGARFTYTEYGKFWDFRQGDVALQADWVEGKDYNNCSSIEEGGKLTGLGCQYSSELVWKAENGGLMLTQFVIGMGDEAKATAAEGKFDDKDLNLRSGSYMANWETGKWRDGSEGQFLVITFATANASVPVETVEKYLRYRHSDTLGALLFR